MGLPRVGSNQEENAQRLLDFYSKNGEGLPGPIWKAIDTYVGPIVAKVAVQRLSESERPEYTRFSVKEQVEGAMRSCHERAASRFREGYVMCRMQENHYCLKPAESLRDSELNACTQNVRQEVLQGLFGRSG